MQLPIEGEVLNNLSAVGLEGSAKVMQWDSRKLSHGPIRNAARQAAGKPSVFPFRAPTTNDVEAFVKFFDERRNLGGIVLQIAVHGDDDFASGGVKPRLQRRSLTKVSPQSDHTNARICFLNIPKNCGAAVCAPVVDEDDLIGLSERAHHLCQRDIKRCRAAFFVKDGYDDRKPDSSWLFHRSCSESVAWTSVRFAIPTIVMLRRPLPSTESMQQNPCSCKAGCHRTLQNS